jgi:hypothetical protein
MTVQDKQQSILTKLPSNAKISVALDCWTSPFQQPFMAITGYFVDDEWKYRELLLGFEPLQGSHTGNYLSEILLKVLQQYDLAGRVLAVTADNASNNHTLIKRIREQIVSLSLGKGTPIIRIPCIAHVIQLSLKALLGNLKLGPVNETAQKEWSNHGLQFFKH